MTNKTVSRVAIIPARGGSKRLLRKNVLPLAGKPMIAHPIQTAMESKLFSKVYVSTEDAEITAVARECGAEVIDRPDDLAGDIPGVDDVLLHVLDTLDERGQLPEEFCCIYATAALLVAQDLIESCRLLEQEPVADYVMGVSAFDIHPFKAMEPRQDDFLVPLWPKENLQRSQEYPKYLASNGTLYWARTEAFRKNRMFYGDKLRGYEVPAERAIDIDTPDDYERAKVYMQASGKGAR